MKTLRSEDDLYDYCEKRGIPVPPHFVDSYYSAIVKIRKGRITYSLDKMIEEDMTSYNCSEDDAMEYIDFNVFGTLPNMGKKRPIIK